MDAGPLDVFENARDQDVLTVADRIDIELTAEQILVDQDRATNAKA